MGFDQPWDGRERRKGTSFDGPCPTGVKHSAEIVSLVRANEDLAEYIKDIATKVEDIKDKLLGRPSWTVTVIITLLSTLSFSSLTFAFTIAHQLIK